MSEQAMQAIANAMNSLQHAHQLLAQSAAYGQGGQVQAGNPSQQAFGNANGMQGVVHAHQQQAEPAQQAGQYGTQQYQAPNQQGFAGGAMPQTGFGDPNAGALNTAQGQATSVTPQMIQTLIAPLVQNESMKAQLSQAMNAMGITNLPDARPDQLPELYQRFQAVANGGGNAQQNVGQFGNGAAPQQQAGNTPNAAAPSII